MNENDMDYRSDAIYFWFKIYFCIFTMWYIMETIEDVISFSIIILLS